MKKIILICSALLSFQLWAASSLGIETNSSSDFITQDSFYIYPSIPFIDGADLMAFHEAYSRTRSEQFQELVQSAESLIKAGASGKEAMDIILAFDKLITDRREYSRRAMGVSLEGFFNGRITDLYDLYQPAVRRLDFKHVDIPTNILAHANRNYRPGYLTDDMLSQIDFVAYGSYSVSAKPGEIFVSIYVVNVKTGVTRVYSGAGRPNIAAYQAADKFFHEFQRTHIPQTLRLPTGKVVTLVKEGKVTGGYSNMKNLYEQASYACEDIGARLANDRELIAFNNLGSYNGGVTVYEGYSNYFYNRHDRPYYYWALNGSLVYIAPENRTAAPWNLNNTEFLNYLCVK